jgi:hypothetical protein
MESQDENFPIERVKLEQCGRDLFAIFNIGHAIKWAGLVVGDLKSQRTVIIPAGLEEFIETGHRSLATLVDHEIAGDGEEPGFESGFAVELAPAGQHTHPDFLEQVLGLLTVSGEEKQITEQAMLIPNDQLVEQTGILSFKSLRNSKILQPDLLISRRDNSRGEECANGRNRTHLALLDDKWLLGAAEKMSFHPNYNDLAEI